MRTESNPPVAIFTGEDHVCGDSPVRRMCCGVRLSPVPSRYASSRTAVPFAPRAMEIGKRGKWSQVPGTLEKVPHVEPL